MHTTSIHTISSVETLRPTAITVGYRDVISKRTELNNQVKQYGQESLAHLFPVVKGPKNQLFLTCNHNLLRALSDEGVEKIEVVIIKDLSSLNPQSFWLVMDHKQWTQPFNVNGCRVAFTAIPRTISKLEDDPFRSLVSELKKVGAINHRIHEYDDFLWNDYLRNQLESSDLINDFSELLAP
jgi:hypothetical protein